MAASDLFDFLARNQQILTWLGGGFATAVGGAWVAVKYFLDRDAKKDEPSATRKSEATPRAAASFGLAAGGNQHVGGNVSIRQNQLPKAGVVLAIIGLLLLGFAVLLTSRELRLQTA